MGGGQPDRGYVPMGNCGSRKPESLLGLLVYSGKGWRTREGVQMQAVAAMVKRLLAD